MKKKIEESLIDKLTEFIKVLTNMKRGETVALRHKKKKWIVVKV